MPLIRCPKCGQPYDVPDDVALKLPHAIATCHCGEWLSASKAALLARRVDVSELEELDMRPYRVDESGNPIAPAAGEHQPDPFDLGSPRHVRVIARGAEASINTIFTIDQQPLWIGRKACHVELDDADLSIRHCSISRQHNDLVIRDADSYTGTYFDGEAITEAVISDGVHLLRVGGALLCVEPTDQPGERVAAIPLAEDELLEASPALVKKLLEKKAKAAAPSVKRAFLLVVDGPLTGQEYEIPQEGLVVGREGHVRVADDYLSRKHFEVRRDEEGSIRVRDLGSRNGTFLNTLPARNTRVHGGDEIRAGVNRFRVEER
jgi:FHA domain.